MKYICLLTVLFWCSALGYATEHRDGHEVAPRPSLLTQKWEADWIACPGISLYEYGVYHFRKEFKLDRRPERFVINISADNRYRLFVNGTPMSLGPARGDFGF